MDKYFKTFSIIILLSGMIIPNGSSAGEFLSIDFSVKGNSMGRASVMADDALDLMVINPASLHTIENISLSLGYYPWYGRNHLINIIAAAPVLKAGIFGMGYSGVIYGHNIGMDVTGQPSGEFKAMDSLFTLSYGRPIVAFLNGGINLKVLKGKIDNDSAISVAFDIGLQGVWLDKALKIGLSAKNLGPKTTFTGRSSTFKLPADIRLGISYLILNKEKLGLNAALEVQLPFNSDPRINGGLEFRYAFLMIRLGDYYFINSSKSSLNSFTTGLGIDMGYFLLKEKRFNDLKFDFTFNSGSVLGPVFQVALTLGVSPGKESSPSTEKKHEKVVKKTVKEDIPLPGIEKKPEKNNSAIKNNEKKESPPVKESGVIVKSNPEPEKVKEEPLAKPSNDAERAALKKKLKELQKEFIDAMTNENLEESDRIIIEIDAIKEVLE